MKTAWVHLFSQRKQLYRTATFHLHIPLNNNKKTYLLLPLAGLYKRTAIYRAFMKKEHQILRVIFYLENICIASQDNLFKQFYKLKCDKKQKKSLKSCYN